MAEHDRIPLELDVAVTRDGPTVTVAGELDMATVTTLVDTAGRHIQGPASRLTIDLSGVVFCDSSGINGLVLLRNQCTEQGWDFRIVHLPRELDRLISDLTGLREFLGIVRD
jgi:anti-anti-sigma factor